MQMHESVRFDTFTSVKWWIFYKVLIAITEMLKGWNI